MRTLKLGIEAPQLKPRHSIMIGGQTLLRSDRRRGPLAYLPVDSGDFRCRISVAAQIV